MDVVLDEWIKVSFALKIIKMLSIENCRKILEKYGKKYTDEEIIEIRELLYTFAKCQIKDLEAGHYDNVISDEKE